ncbi:hard surface induced protein [Apodospora peruviana]|uniref:Hard surface induced protein n=1 Tax=Apodospora peruviana TaxID=516989 RepID=A0AAE0HTS8_9PEZI|nr:hard surface induced protein [Apodospora peruviana]
MSILQLPAGRPGGSSSPASVGKWLLLTLTPSFIDDKFHHGSDRRGRRAKLHATSYLDGLRGLAACSVFAYHYTDYNHKFYLPFYGHNDDSNEHDGPSGFMQLPYVRLLYAGTPMVHVFFVISGFALSLRPLQYLYNEDYSSSRGPSPAAVAKSQALIASSAFRRPIRLFLPPLAVTAIAAAEVYILGWMPSFMRAQPNLGMQIADWASDAVNNLMWPWSWDDGSPRSRYNPHLWTIPMEFTHSMFLFLVLLVLSRLRGPLTRQLTLVCLMIYCLLITRWAAFEFLGGAFLAELHLSSHFKASSAHLPNNTTDNTKTEGQQTPPSSFSKTILRLVVLVSAGFLLCWPARKDDMTPLLTWIENSAPGNYKEGKDFWLAIAAFSTVWCAGRISVFRRILESSVPQYAGRISFCLYMFQHMILNLMQHHVLGSEYKPATDERQEELAWGVRGTFGISSPTQRFATWWTGLIIMGLMLVCLADLMTRVLDSPVVRLSKRLEGLAFAPGADEVAGGGNGGLEK